MEKGDKVIVRPPDYPGQEWPGVLVRKIKFGWIVQYESFGVQYRGAYGEQRLEKV